MATTTSAPVSNTTAPAAAAILEMVTSFWASRAVYAAAKLGVADAMAEGARSASEVAAKTGSAPASMFRLLRALASVNLVEEAGGEKFRLTAQGETLRSGAPDSVRDIAIAILGDDHYEAWGELVDSVRNGETAFQVRFGMPVFDYYTRNSEAGSAFGRAMTQASSLAIPQVLANYSFARYKHAIDVGGGNGHLLAAVLHQYPALRGTLFDLPSVGGAARARLQGEGLAARANVISGDFFKSVPAGGDIYLLKWILHDWNDDQCVEILRNIRGAIAPGGRLAVIEALIGSGPWASLCDLNMMVMTGGRERTEEEFADLFQRSGFRLSRVITLTNGMAVIEAAAV